MKNTVILSILTSICVVISLSADPIIGSKVTFSAKSTSGEMVSFNDIKGGKIVMVIAIPKGKWYNKKWYNLDISKCESAMLNICQTILNDAAAMNFLGNPLFRFIVVPKEVSVSQQYSASKIFKDSHEKLASALGCLCYEKIPVMYCLILDKKNVIQGVVSATANGTLRTLDFSGFPGGYRIL